MKTPQGVIRGIITDPDTGEQIETYARIPVRLTPKALAKAYAAKAMQERYQAEMGKYDEIQQAVFCEIYDDFMKGFQLGFERQNFSLEDFYNHKTAQR